MSLKSYIYKSSTLPVTFSFNGFSKAAFLANGGQIFMSTNSGTATIGLRGIYIERSGADMAAI